MEGQRVTEGGYRRISEGSLVRITEDYIRVWALTPSSVSLSTSPSTTSVSVDTTVISTTLSLNTSVTNTSIIIDIDTDTIVVPVGLLTSATNTTVEIDIDYTLTSTTGTLTLSPQDTTIVIIIDVEVNAVPLLLEMDHSPTVTFVDRTLLERDSRLYKIYLLSSIDVVTAVIKAIPVKLDYVFDSNHEYLDDLGVNTLTPTVTLSGSRWLGLNGEFKYSPNKLKFLTVTGDVAAFILFRDTGNTATSELISYHREDFKGLTKGLAAETLDWTLNTGGFFDKEPENVYVGRVTSYIDRIAKSNIRI